MTIWKSYVGPILLCLAAALVLYYPSCAIGYYGYDFQYVFAHASLSNIFYYFTHAVPYCKSYHPLPAALLMALQSLWGINTLPLHILQIGLHGLFGFLILRAMPALQFPRRAAVAAALFFLIAQANVMAVAGNSGLPHLGAALASCGSMWLLLRKPQQDLEKRITLGRYLGSLGLYTLALLCGETAIVFFLPILVLLYLRIPRTVKGRLLKFVLYALPFIFIMVDYIGIRYWLGVRVFAFNTSDIFSLRLGRTIFENMAQLLLSLTLPLSSVSVYTAIQTHAVPTLIKAGCAAAVIGAIMILGLWRQRTIALLGLLALLPFLFLGHVSESFSYALIPFAAISLGAGVAALLSGKFARGWRFYAIIIVLATLAGSQISAVQSKISLMHQTSVTTAHLAAQLEPIVKPMPAGYKIVFINPPPVQLSYAIFRMNGFTALEQEWPFLTMSWGRSDDLGPYALVEYEDVPHGIGAFFKDDATLWLTIENGRVVPFLPRS